MKYKTIKIEKSSKADVDEQLELRMKRILSVAHRNVLQILADNTGADGVPLADLMEVNNESARDASNRISHMRTTHGLDIVNISPRSNAGSVYRLVGFTQPGERKPNRKPKLKKEKGELVMPKVHNSLLLQVFC